MQQDVLLLSRQLIPRRLDLKAKGFSHRIEQGEVIGVVLFSPGSNSRVDRQGRIRDDPLFGELAQMANAMAIRASAIGTVEGEEPRRELLHHRAVDGAGEVLGIEALLLDLRRQLLTGLRHHFDQGQTITALERRAQGIRQALLNPLTGHQAIHHHLDVVGVVLVELNVVGKFTHLAIDPYPGKALGHQAGQQLDVGALLAANHRGEKLVTGPLRQGEDLIDHLVDGLGPDRAVALGAVGLACSAKQETQIVLDLRDRSHRGTRVMAGGFLVNRDRRREALDRIHIRLVDLAEELPGVSRKTLDVAALAFRKNRVEGQRALTAAADPGEDHQLVAGNRDVDVLEVVLAGAPHPNHIL